MMQATNPSVALTHGVRVMVTSHYLAEQSNPAGQRYVWAYTVRISNEGREAAKLVTRHWIIINAGDGVEEVKGPGVIGKQPRLEPGDQFQYTSGCILETPRGTMHGTYQMVRDDGEGFDAAIAPFTLEMPLALN